MNHNRYEAFIRRELAAAAKERHRCAELIQHIGEAIKGARALSYDDLSDAREAARQQQQRAIERLAQLRAALPDEDGEDAA